MDLFSSDYIKILKYIDNKDLHQNHINNSKSFILKNFQKSLFNNNLKKVIKDLDKKT